MISIVEGRDWAKVSEAALGKRAAYIEHGVLDDTADMLRIKLVGTRVAEIAKKIKYANDAKIGLPPEEERSITCGKFPLWHQRRKITQKI